MSPTRLTRHAGAAIALGLHAAVGAALLSYEPARAALLAAAPIMVEFITPVPVEAPQPQPQPQIEPPKPRPVVKRRPKPVEPPPVVSAPVEAPSPVVVAPPPPEPPPVVAEIKPAPPPPPVAVTQPIFTADYLNNPAPDYPMQSRRLREEGKVILRVLVSTAGTAAEVQIRASSGYVRLDDSARETVRRWKFIPAKRGAEPIAAWVLVPISFGVDS